MLFRVWALLALGLEPLKWSGEFRAHAGCLGNLGDVFGISAESADWIAKGILAYLLVGSGAILLSCLKRGRGGVPGQRDRVELAVGRHLPFEAQDGKTGI